MLTDKRIRELWENYSPTQGIESFARAVEAAALESQSREIAALKEQVEFFKAGTVPKVEDINAQRWDRVDGAIAFHLIDRHGEDWSHIGRLMNAWRDAAIAAKGV